MKFYLSLTACLILTVALIRPAQSQTLNITKPTGTEQVKFGQQLQVAWINTGASTGDLYYLYYSKDAGNYTNFYAAYNYQITKSGDTLKYTWTLPDFGTDFDSDLKIRVWNSTSNVSDTSEAFRVYYEPAIAIGNPKSTNEIKFGQQLTVSWHNGDRTTGDLYYLYYSKDGAAYINFYAAYGYQITSVGDSLKYTWTLPDFGTDNDSQLKIRVWNSTRDVSDTSDAFRVYYEPSVTIGTPKSTDERKFGQQMTISWHNGDHTTSDLYYLYYSKDGAAYNNFYAAYGYQITAVGDSLKYTWTLPDFGTDNDSQVKIRVWNSTRDVSDTSDAFRVYYEPSVTIGTPKNTDELKFGNQLVVSWHNGDRTTSDLYYLYYSKDGAAYNNFYAAYGYQITAVGDSLKYTWTLPDFGTDAESDIKIRVWNATRDVSDTSAAFRVYYEPSVKIVSPEINSEGKFGSQMMVAWVNGDRTTSDLYYLYYSKDGGAYTNFYAAYGYQISAAGDSLKYTWTLPDFGADADSEVKIRVWNATRDVSDTSDAFRIYYEPSVAIGNPKGTDERKFGQQMTITWHNGDRTTSDLYYLYYSKDGEAFTNFFAAYGYQITAVGDSLKYNWTIPDFGADLDSELKIRLWNATRDVADTSEAFRVYYEPSVQITAPFPDEYVLQNTNKKISWINGDHTTSDYYQLYYSVDGGNYTNFYNVYNYQLTNTNGVTSLNWSVPNIQGNNVKLVVKNYTRNVSDTTASFTVCATCPAVAIYTPNGGEILGIGKQVNISWSVGSTWVSTDNIKVEYSLDGGSSYESTAIFDGLYSSITDNTVVWTVSGSETNQAMIRVTNVTQAASDVSDAVFTLVNPPAVPTNFIATTNADHSISLSWTDNSSNEIYSVLEYSTDRSTWYNYSGTLAVDQSNYNTGAIGEYGYWWRIKVYSQYFSEVSAPIYAGAFTPFGRALAFDGSDDKVALPDSDFLKFGTGDFTIETWFNATNASVTQVLNSNYNGTANFYVFYLNGTKLYASLGSGQGDIFGTTALQNNIWYHAALVKSGDIISLYLNGQLEGTVTGAASRDITTNAGVIELGRQGAGTSYYFNGEMDEVRFWNIARSQAQIADRKDTVLIGNESGLVAYYQMDHTAGTYVSDKTSKALHGIWSGTSGANTNSKWPVSEVGVDKTPKLTVLTPNGGESLVGATTYEISWTAENIAASDLIEIRLSTDGGDTYNIIADGNFGMYSGKYNWTVSNSPTTTALIQIANTTTPLSDASDAIFTITPAVPVILLTYPNGGETFTVGKTYGIKWSTANIPSTDLIEISVSTDGGANYSLLADGTFANYAGVFNWTVNANTSAQAKIKVTNTTQSVSDESDANFTIAGPPAVITLQAPNGQEVFTTGQSVSINWQTENIPVTNALDIQLSLDNGGSFETIASGTVETLNGTYSWTVPETVTSFGRIRIVDVASGTSDVSDSYFTIRLPAAVTVTSPNGGEIWEVGKQYTIYWNPVSFDASDYLKIELSADGGDSYTTLNEGGVYNNQYTFVMPDQVSTNAVVRVSNTTKSVSDVSDAPFTIKTTPVITLLSPNGQEVFTTGQSVSINWQTANIPVTNTLDIQLSLDNGGSFETIASGTVETLNGTYSWTVPETVTSFGRIRIVDAASGTSDVSDSYFTIRLPAAVTVTSPNGGEIWEVGKQYTIYWNPVSFDGSDYLKIELSADGGDSYTTLSEGGVYNNQYTFVMPDQVSTNAVVRVSNTTKSVSDVSDAPFTIKTTPVITLLSPNGQEVFTTGQSVSINWQTANIPVTNTLDIQLSLDNGGSFETIASGTVETLNGSYSWTVPETVTNLARIRIIDQVAGTSDISDSYFTIQLPASVTVTSPNGGEAWEVGKQYIISWNPVSFSGSDYIVVELSADGGNTYSILSEGGNYNNQYPFVMPDLVSTNALVRVRNTTKDVSDVSEPFSIVKINRSIAITNPTPGATLVQGESVTVSFTTQNILDTDNVDFYLSVDGGQSFQYILAQGALTDYAKSNSFTWFINQPVTQQAMLRARVTNENVVAFTETFIIKEAPQAPVFNSLQGAIIGNDFTSQINLNEAGIVYLTILPDGMQQPAAADVKAAALGESTIEGQAFAQNYAYTQAGSSLSISGEANFTRQTYYDFYFAAEDVEGNLSTTYQLSNVFVQFTPLEKDSIVVNVIYQEMGGQNWNNVAENWINLPLSGRSEIVVKNKRISELHLNGKSLTGTLPSNILNLDSLATLDLKENMIVNLPVLTSLKKLKSLNVSSNYLDFGDLQSNSTLFTQIAQYSPQTPYLEAETRYLPKGSSYFINHTLNGDNNEYTWKVDYFKEYQEEYVDIPEATQGFLQITSLDYSNMGSYYTEVVNSSLPGLTIVSNPVGLWATAQLEINVVDKDNLPVASGSAYALRDIGPGIPYDSLPKAGDGSPDPRGLLFTNGKAVFEQIILGNYLISIRSEDTKYLPTYYSNTYLWEEADTLQLRGNRALNMEMFQIPDPLTPDDGSGLVSGTVESDFADEEEGGRVLSRKKVKRAGCSMRRFVASGRGLEDGDWELVAYVESDDDGKFVFEYLPQGRYRFNIEYPGIPMDPNSYVEFTVGEEGDSDGTLILQAIVTEDGIVVERTNALGIGKIKSNPLSVYPNPANDWMTINLKAEEKVASVRILDLNGRVVWQQNEAELNEMEINTSQLTSGQYLLQVWNPKNHSYFIVQKFVIKH